MDKTIEELREEADVLGIKYNPNIGVDKLGEKIEAYYTNQAAGDSVKVQPEVEEPKVESKKTKTEDSKEVKFRKKIAAAKARALKTRVVTVINNDIRESSVLTADYFSFENQHFGKSLIVPFNIATELPQCIIDTINSAYITQHVDEVIGGKRTGNKIPRSVRKYTVSYEDMK